MESCWMRSSAPRKWPASVRGSRPIQSPVWKLPDLPGPVWRHAFANGEGARTTSLGVWLRARSSFWSKQNDASRIPRDSAARAAASSDLRPIRAPSIHTKCARAVSRILPWRRRLSSASSLRERSLEPLQGGGHAARPSRTLRSLRLLAILFARNCVCVRCDPGAILKPGDPPNSATPAISVRRLRLCSRIQTLTRAGR